ncbi:MAG: CMP-binding protein [Phycisphaeraceae bacterium]|nr:CMP-binding protein [Phycisphaeraceae bacterium]
MPNTRTYIRDLKPSQYVDGVYAVQNCQLGQTKNGKPYLKCLLADKTGRTPGRMWNITEEQFRGLPTDGFVWIAGQSQPYQGEIQVIIQDIRAYEPSPDELTDLLPTTPHNVDEMFAELLRILQKIEHPAMAALRDRYLEDGKLMESFCRAPAASSLHHAYLGGLLEHTLQLLRIADALLPLYPQLSGDLVRFGLFLHDLGKTAELTWETGFAYSDDGQLVGHVGRGLVWLNDKARACAEMSPPVIIPPAILLTLEHLILSHHGELEFGALKVPATPEAIFINHVDNIDAKLHMALAAAAPGREAAVAEGDASTSGGGNFTEKVWALNTRIYRPDPTR